MDTVLLNNIAEYLQGTCKGVADAAEAFNVDEDTVYKAIEHGEIECCNNCDWWSDDCRDVPNGDMICDECLKEDPDAYGVESEED